VNARQFLAWIPGERDAAVKVFATSYRSATDDASRLLGCADRGYFGDLIVCDTKNTRGQRRMAVQP
jgi:hypothetical protein